MDMDMCQDSNIVDKVRNDDSYAQNLYAALCNTEWQYQDVWPILQGKTWACSWRTAGGIVADIRKDGDYMDWYCSGSMMSHPDDGTGETKIQAVGEGTVTEEIRQDLLAIGWVEVG